MLVLISGHKIKQLSCQKLKTFVKSDSATPQLFSYSATHLQSNVNLKNSIIFIWGYLKFTKIKLEFVSSPYTENCNF